MAKYHHFDVARWEGEGGASDESPALSNATRFVDVRDRKNRSAAFLQVLSGIMFLVASVAFARRKGWI